MICETILANLIYNRYSTIKRRDKRRYTYYTRARARTWLFLFSLNFFKRHNLRPAEYFEGISNWLLSGARVCVRIRACLCVRVRAFMPQGPARALQHSPAGSSLHYLTPSAPATAADLCDKPLRSDVIFTVQFSFRSVFSFSDYNNIIYYYIRPVRLIGDYYYNHYLDSMWFANVYTTRVRFWRRRTRR